MGMWNSDYRGGETMRVGYKSALLFGLAVTATACGSMRVVPSEVFASTPGLVIEGNDFRIATGEAIPLPFVMAPARADEDIIDLYDEYRDEGAREVRVHIPGREEPLHGLLSLHALPETAKGPARRSLSVQVPQRYVDAATNGRVSVVFEPVNADPDTYYGWVLWMSDRPF